MFKPIQFLMVAPAAAWPGKAAIRKDGNTIFKTMLGPSHPQISIKSAFKLEVEALTRLESSRKELMCDNGRRHFPAVEDNEQKNVFHCFNVFYQVGTASKRVNFAGANYPTILVQIATAYHQSI